jgi:hypothetical protein
MTDGLAALHRPARSRLGRLLHHLGFGKGSRASRDRAAALQAAQTERHSQGQLAGAWQGVTDGTRARRHRRRRAAGTRPPLPFPQTALR